MSKLAQKIDILHKSGQTVFSTNEPTDESQRQWVKQHLKDQVLTQLAIQLELL